MKLALFYFIVLWSLGLPLWLGAQIPSIVPPCPSTGCGWAELVKLGANIMTFMIVLAVPLSAIAFAWAGFLYLTAGGSEEKIKKATGIFWKVAIGFVFVLGAWLLVYTITSTLLKREATLLEEVR